ncbi:MAG: gliding motility protein GldL [Prevotella sp.]|nr:gliding motility protein GldL [Prevotella sp.]
MSNYSKLNIVYRLQKWMDSVPGQTFLNYAYSWGASVVILGTLFKLTHLPGANIMLFAGMGTEVFVFFLSAFDRPFDKTAIGMDLPTHLYEEEENDEEAEGQHDSNACTAATAGGATVVGTPVGGTIIIGGGATAGNATANDADSSVNGADSSANAAAQAGTGGGATLVSNVPSWVEAQQQVSPELAEAQGNYVEELKKLTEMLQKVSEQSARLTRDSEEMENLNRTLTGICKVYEMQLKSASQQIGTIDQINDQSRRMAQQIEQLNSIYARMIEAMTVNMKGVNPGA